MNINPEHEQNFELDAETAMERGELSETDQTLLAVIGSTLKVIAEKAQAYEQLQNLSDKNNHYRN